MTKPCEVNIPEYLKSMGFEEEEIRLNNTRYMGYEIQLVSETVCFNAGYNLPWSFSLTKPYQLLLRVVGGIAYYLNCADLADWTRREFVQIGRNELQSFFDEHKAHENSNFRPHTYSGADAFIYTARQIE